MHLKHTCPIQAGARRICEVRRSWVDNYCIGQRDPARITGWRPVFKTNDVSFCGGCLLRTPLQHLPWVALNRLLVCAGTPTTALSASSSGSSSGSSSSYFLFGSSSVPLGSSSGSSSVPLRFLFRILFRLIFWFSDSINSSI